MLKKRKTQPSVEKFSPNDFSKYWDTDKEKAERIIRVGLKRYSDNDILLNWLMGVFSLPEIDLSTWWRFFIRFPSEVIR